MKILIDECLPKKLKREFPNHDVATVPEMGWAGKKNGELLSLMQDNFDVFMTIDSNMKYQQNLEDVEIGYVLLKSKSNRLDDLLPLMPNVRQILDNIKVGDVITVSSEDEG